MFIVYREKCFHFKNYWYPTYKNDYTLIIWAITRVDSAPDINKICYLHFTPLPKNCRKSTKLKYIYMYNTNTRDGNYSVLSNTRYNEPTDI